MADAISSKLRHLCSYTEPRLHYIPTMTASEHPPHHVHTYAGDSHGHAPGNHNHGHDHNPVDPELRKALRGLRRILGPGNLAIGLGQLVAGNLSTLAVTSDGAHNVAEFKAYGEQTKVAATHHEMSAEQIDRSRKITYWLLSTCGVLVTAKAGVDWKTGHDHVSNTLTIPLSAASLSLNGYAFAKLWRAVPGRLRDASVHVKDIAKHMWFNDIPSASLAVAGALTQNSHPGLGQAVAAASGAVSAWVFRPTPHNLAHTHELPPPNEPPQTDSTSPH
jgi:hypothetical protein